MIKRGDVNSPQASEDLLLKIKMADSTKRIQNPQDMYEKRVIVTPKPIVTLPGDCLVKVYDMFYEGKSRNTSSWTQFLSRKVENRFGNTGLGFLINSDGMMNLSEWEQYTNTNPEDVHSNMILKNRIFTFDEKNIETSFKEGDVRELGTYCQHELAIVSHERKAMINHVRSIIFNIRSLENWMDDVYKGIIPY